MTLRVTPFRSHVTVPVTLSDYALAAEKGGRAAATETAATERPAARDADGRDKSGSTIDGTAAREVAGSATSGGHDTQSKRHDRQVTEQEGNPRDR
jgi:hypothetical protein